MSKLNILTVTDEQLSLIQASLELYSRIGIGQFDVIKEHPTFQKYLYKLCIPVKTIEVGDSTPQGKILEVKNGKALIAGRVKDGLWNKEYEWKKLSDVKLSTDYSKYHDIRSTVDSKLFDARSTLIQDSSIGFNGSWGIYNEEVDDTCRMAYDIVQVIRHKRWKEDEERSNMTVDSSIHFSHRKDRSSELIMCNKL